MNVDTRHMSRALELAAQGQGHVEPNPMVGCVLARDEETIAEGWHQKFGGPHAEFEALRQAGEAAQGATMYVTLEPCSHQGKTPPCCRAVAAAGVQRVVVAQQDPFAEVAGAGIEFLRQAGIQVELGLLAERARHLNAPYLKLIETGRPWIIAKWAMSADGKIATATGDSRWISNAASRAVAHQLRGRVDAIIVGSNTAKLDDPLLTARPAGPRTATRVVVDSRAALDPDSQLVRTARDVPLIVAAAADAPAERIDRLSAAGCEVFTCKAATHGERLEQLLAEMGRRRMTNILVEGGAALLGEFFDRGAIDEAHVFIAPKLIGGATAFSALGGAGAAKMSQTVAFVDPQADILDGDVYLRGRLDRGS